jgi:hypothetical protein
MTDEGAMEIARGMAANPQLRTLEICGTRLEDGPGVLALSKAIVWNSQLERIDLDGFTFPMRPPNGAIRVLVNALPTWENLEFADFSRNVMDDGLVARLAYVLPHMQSLRCLVIRHVDMTPCGAILLAGALRVPGCPLQELDISHNPIGDDAVVVLEDAMGDMLVSTPRHNPVFFSDEPCFYEIYKYVFSLSRFWEKHTNGEDDEAYSNLKICERQSLLWKSNLHAFAMGFDTRLGEGSVVHTISQDLFKMIAREYWGGD